MLDELLGLTGVEPDAMTVGTLVDLDPVPIARHEVVAALGALHVVGPARGLRDGALRRLALLAQQLRIALDEVFVLVLARLLVRRHCVWTLNVSPPRVGPCFLPGGEEDCPLYMCPGQRTMASTTRSFCSVTRSNVPQVRSQPFGKNRYV